MKKKKPPYGTQHYVMERGDIVRFEFKDEFGDNYIEVVIVANALRVRGLRPLSVDPDVANTVFVKIRKDDDSDA